MRNLRPNRPASATTVASESSISRAGESSGDRAVDRPLDGFTIAIAYDGIFPWSIGGAERWYRALAEGLARAGARVTYVTRVQWDEGEEPKLDGIDVVPVPGPRDIYHPDGKRRADQPVRYAAGLFGWMIRNRRSFDALHLSNFPYFSLPASRAALLGTGKPIFVDWFEVWPRTYWIDYAGSVVGRVGYFMQQLCARLTPIALVFWDHTALRLAEHGLHGDVVVLPGLLPESRPVDPSTEARSGDQLTVFFSGRHIRDKGVRMLPEALQIARQSVPGLRMVIAGDGVETPLVKSRVSEFDLVDAVDFVGKLSDEELFRRVSEAACVAVPSVREGYGLAAVEAAAHGTPAVVADGPENATVGHIVEGRNGFVVAATPAGVAEGIVKAVRAGQPLRETTVQEFRLMAEASSMQRSIDEVISLYVERLAPERRVVGRTLDTRAVTVSEGERSDEPD